MTEVTQLSATERVKGRPFTDPLHRHTDMERMHRMINLVIDKYDDPAVCDFTPGKRPVCQSDHLGRHYRIYYIHPKLLFKHRPITVVGFFGHKRHGADVTPLVKADRQFEHMFHDHPGLLSLTTVRLVDGNFGNLVLFTDEAAKDHWGQDPAHSGTVAAVSPPYYSHVRLCNGVLPEGLADPHQLALTRVKYLDYSVTPLWRAVRTMEPV